MAENDQHLKHGKALCGKVFGRFVETFNALVDFMLGLRGDADGKNGEGHITYDRKNNIIRCDGCGGKGGSGSGVTAAEGSGLSVEDGEIDISGREEDDAFGIRNMTVKGEDDAEDKTVKFIGTENVEIPKGGAGGVTSLNGLTGALTILGGKSVKIEVAGKNAIRISIEEGKEPDPEPTQGDPCDHPGDTPGTGKGGGVSPEEEEEHGGGGAAAGGGVPADDDSHAGEPCPDCSPKS